MTKIDQALRPDVVEGLLKSSFRTTVLFELLANKEKLLTLGEISDFLKIPQSSASALVKSLLDTGYLQKDESRKGYNLSARLPFLGASMRDAFPELPKLTMLANNIKGEIGETIIITMRNRLFSQYVYVSRVAGQKADEHVVLGSMRPLVCSATGWAMLMQTDDDEIGKLIRSTCATITDPYWIKTARQASASIKTTKENGFAFSKGPSKKGTAGIAFPLKIAGNMSSSSIGVAGREKDLIAKKDYIIALLSNLIAS